MQEKEYSKHKYSIPNNQPYYYRFKQICVAKFHQKLPKMPLAIRNIHFTTNQKLIVISMIGAYVIQDVLGIYAQSTPIRDSWLIEMNNIYQYKFKRMNAPRHVFKRVKERSIMEAKQSVDQWRSLFKNGEVDDNGNRIKYNLKQAAEKVGVPKKTLEDYRQLLKKAEQYMDLESVGDKKMGYLRNLLKQQQQQFQQTVFSDEEMEVKQEDIDEELQEYEDMIVEGPILEQYTDYNEFLPSLSVQTVLIEYQQPLPHKKWEISESDQEDCDTDDEFDYE